MTVAALGPPDVILDKAVPAELADRWPCTSYLLEDARVGQHALMTAWQGAPVWIGCQFDVSDTVVFRIHVPPKVERADFALMVSGGGSFQVTSTTHTGTLTVAPPQNPAALGNASLVFAKRQLDVASSATWAWTTEDITVTGTAAASGFDAGVCYGIFIEFEHVAS